MRQCNKEDLQAQRAHLWASSDDCGRIDGACSVHGGDDYVVGPRRQRTEGEAARGIGNCLQEDAIDAIVVFLLDRDHSSASDNGLHGDAVDNRPADRSRRRLERHFARVHHGFEPILAVALSDDGRASIEVQIEVFVVARGDSKLATCNLAGWNLDGLGLGGKLQSLRSVAWIAGQHRAVSAPGTSVVGDNRPARRQRNADLLIRAWLNSTGAELRQKALVGHAEQIHLHGILQQAGREIHLVRIMVRALLRFDDRTFREIAPGNRLQVW